MARAEIPFAVTNTATGAAVPGASVQVNTRGGTPATVYATENPANPSTLANPLTTTIEGRIEGWLEEGSYNLVVSGTGITTYTQHFEASRGDGVSKYAAGSVTKAALATVVAQALLPPGSVLPFAGTAAPAGFLLANGSEQPIATNGDLYSVLGTTYGPLTNGSGGAGTTHFRLPDYRGRILIGLGTHTEVDAITKNDGSDVSNRRAQHGHSRGTLSVSNGATGISIESNGSHFHSPDNGRAFSTTNTSIGLAGDGGAQPGWFPDATTFNTNSAGAHVHSVTDPQHNHGLSGVIGDGTASNAPSYHVVNFIIKT